jgi:hypothetical protein
MKLERVLLAELVEQVARVVGLGPALGGRFSGDAAAV